MPACAPGGDGGQQTPRREEDPADDFTSACASDAEMIVGSGGSVGLRLEALHADGVERDVSDASAEASDASKHRDCMGDPLPPCTPEADDGQRTPQGDEEAPKLTREFMGFSDDLTLYVDGVLVDAALEAAEVELRDVGLSLNLTKSRCLGAARPPGARAAALWDATHADGGIVALGAPMAVSPAAAAGDCPGDDEENDGEFDLDFAFPIGTPEFISRFLQKYAEKIEDLIDHIVALPSRCSPQRCGLQAANLMLRHCTSAKAAHLLQVLPADLAKPFAERLDAATDEAFRLLNEQPPLEGWRATALGMPIRKGGVGLRRLAWTAEAAGAFMQVVPHLHERLGLDLEDGRDEANAFLNQAAANLEETYRTDVWKVMRCSRAELLTKAARKGQRRLTEAIHECIDMRWRTTLPPLAEAMRASCATAAAGDWLLAPPSDRLRLPDAHLRCY